MPETLNNPAIADLEQSAFRGLESYEEKHSAFFFGREEEIKDLYPLIKYSTLTLIFGKSGTGKTSLLNAGVFPLLRKDHCLPFRIRLTFNENSPSLIEQVWEVLKSKIQEYHFRIHNYVEGETLWEFFHREDLWKVVTPILVIDQFEEIFTLPGKYPHRKEELESLIKELADLIENTMPVKVKNRYLESNKPVEYDYKKKKVKVIFAFREDFLAEMESITSRIPSVKNARFRLMPMNGTKAYEVITKTWGSAVDDTQAEKIVSYLVKEDEEDPGKRSNLRSRFELEEVEPSLLSQVCASLDKERLKAGLDKISADFLKKFPKNNILRSIYYKALEDSLKNDTAIAGSPNAKTKHAAEQALKNFIEDNLVNEKGFREKLASKDIDAEFMPGVNGLKSRFFIRQDGVYIELTHDVIAAIIKQERDKRLKAEADKAAKKKALAIVVAALLFSLVVYAVAYKKTANRVMEKEKEVAAEQKKVDNLKTKFRNDSSQYNKFNNKTIEWRKKQITIADTVYRLGDTVYIQMPAAPATAGTETPIGSEDSLRKEITRQKNILADWEALINGYKTTIDLNNQEIGQYKTSMEKARIENRTLQNQINQLNPQVISLNDKLKKISMDVSFFNIYHTHLDSLSQKKNSLSPELKHQIEAMEINWEPFMNRTRLVRQH